jgi:predicted ATPase
MRVTSVEIDNYRALAHVGPLALAGINVLIGPNNGGKSSLIRALYLMQQGSEAAGADVRLGSGPNASATITIGLDNIAPVPPWAPSLGQTENVRVVMDLSWSGAFALTLQALGETIPSTQLLAEEPNHLVVPYLSKRKAYGYAQDVSRSRVLGVTPSLQYLAARLSRLGNPAFPAHQRYAQSCEEILGFVVTAIPAQNGQEPGIYVTNDDTIPLSAMGEGVPNIVGLLVDLALSRQKLFLIEEIENDLHPLALKALLRLVLESAKTDDNQFVVSTHSNIVARYLASADDSKLFQVASQGNALPPQATIREVPPDPGQRMAVLHELGYELNDFNLWEGWIFLEEASAERIIRDHLIPWFAPRLLQRVRTLSANGNTTVEPTFDDFHRLVRFTHLEPVYRERAWVIIDGDSRGRGIIERLRAKYVTWDPNHFIALTRSDFEAYYPERFAEARASALQEPDRQVKRERKRELLEQVRAWCEQEPADAKAEFETSAVEVIEILGGIETALFS